MNDEPAKLLMTLLRLEDAHLREKKTQSHKCLDIEEPSIYYRESILNGDKENYLVGNYFQLHVPFGCNPLHTQKNLAGLQKQIRDKNVEQGFIFGISHIAHYLKRYGFIVAQIPESIAQSCPSYKAYSDKNLYTEISRGENGAFTHLDKAIKMGKLLKKYPPKNVFLAIITIRDFLDLNFSTSLGEV